MHPMCAEMVRCQTGASTLRGKTLGVVRLLSHLRELIVVAEQEDATVHHARYYASPFADPRPTQIPADCSSPTKPGSTAGW